MRASWLTIWIAVSVCTQGYGATESNAVPASGATIQLTAAERAWMKAHPEVHWGADPYWPPFTSLDDNHQLIGIDADIVHLTAARVGLRVKSVSAKSWADVLAKTKTGEVDFLSATAKTPERLGTFDYTRDYGSFPVVIITRQEGPFLTPESDLRRITVSEARDHATTLRVQHDFPMVHVVLTDTVEESIKLVSQGKVDATVQNLAVACRIIRLNNLTDLKISGITRVEFPMHMAVRKDLPELTSILNKGLATITPDEEERIYAAHLMPDIAKARNWGMWRRRAIRTAEASAVVITVALLWNYFLRRQIRRREKAEGELREARDRLQRRTDELKERIQEVERLNSELHVANEDLESFSITVSHDLRAPLRRVGAFAEMLTMEAGGSLTEEERQWTTTIFQESRSMDRLIHDLLEFARLGRADLRKRPVNMRDLVDNVIATFHPQYENRKVIWEVGDLVEVNGDRNLLHYAMLSLIDNALKYTRRREETRIKIDILKEVAEKDMVAFYVKDNGCGFDMHQAKSLFSPFQRLHGDEEFEGTGIGLASVHRIIQRHGGRMWFDSEPDKGATFYFTLISVAQKAYSV